MDCISGAAPFTGSLEGHRVPAPPEQTSASQMGAPLLPVAARGVQGVCFSQVDAQLVPHSTWLPCKKKKKKKIPVVRGPKLASP